MHLHLLLSIYFIWNCCIFSIASQTTPDDPSTASLAANSSFPLSPSNSISQNINSAGSSTLGNLFAQIKFASVQNLLDTNQVTLFLPSEAAITQAISDGVLNIAAIQNITNTLSYHLLPGIHNADSFNSTVQFLPTFYNNQTHVQLGGGPQVLGVSEGGISNGMITGHIVSKDIQCSNGIIHVIDAVLLPPKKAPLTIMHHPELAAFSNITQSNNLTNILSSHQTTIFAPNNAAWGNFSYSTQPIGILIRDVKYQVAHGVFRSTDLSTGSLTSISGQQIKVDTSNGSVTINGAHIIQADVLTSEGVIHIIDKVIDPVTATTSIDPSATQHYHTTPSMIPASHNSGSGLSHPNCTLFSLFVLILQNLIFLL